MDILKVKDLKTYFFIKGKELPAVDGVSFNLKFKEILAVIGESGSGKRVSHEFKSHRFKESLSLFWGLNLWLHFNTNSLELSFNPWLGHANSFSDTIFTNFGMREVKGCGYEEVLKNKRLLK